MNYSELEKRFRDEVLSKSQEEMEEFILNCEPTALGSHIRSSELSGMLFDNILEYSVSAYYMKGDEISHQGYKYICALEGHLYSPINGCHGNGWVFTGEKV